MKLSINGLKGFTAVVVSALMIMTAGCGNTQGEYSEKSPEKLVVLAAASLKNSLADIKTVYEGEHTKVSLTFSFGSSGALQQQIENGAEADIFLSAATKQMDALQEKGLILEDTRRNFLQNEVVLIAPKGTVTVNDFSDLTSEKIAQIGLGEPKAVPAGQYADEVLTTLELKDKIKGKVVYGNDVKEVLAWVETGNVDAGIVYSTDAKASDKVQVVKSAPEGSHKPIYYPAAVLKGSKHTEAAREFTEFLYSSEAKSIFEKYGFIFLSK